MQGDIGELTDPSPNAHNYAVVSHCPRQKCRHPSHGVEHHNSLVHVASILPRVDGGRAAADFIEFDDGLVY
jgi:hypothetical protein